MQASNSLFLLNNVTICDTFYRLRSIKVIQYRHMEDTRAKACRRCGACCTVDMMAYVSPEDRERWETEGRTDILSRLDDNSVTWAGDRLVSRAGLRVMNCIYLSSNGVLCSCEIYSTRPRVCLDYVPGSSELCPLFSKTEAEVR